MPMNKMKIEINSFFQMSVVHQYNCAKEMQTTVGKLGKMWRDSFYFHFRFQHAFLGDAIFKNSAWLKILPLTTHIRKHFTIQFF